MNQTLNRKLSNFFYFIFTFLSIMSLSSWNLFYTSFNFSAAKIIFSLILLIFIGFFTDWNFKRMLLDIVLFVLTVLYFFLYKITYIIPILLAISVGTGMKFKQILNIDFKSRCISVLFVIFLSLISVLPKSGDGAVLTGFHFTKYCYGFTYPNILGFQITVLVLEFIIIYAARLKVKYIMCVVALGTLAEISLNYETGLISILIGVLSLFFIKNKILDNLIRVSSYFMVLLTILSIYIAENYSATNTNWFNLNTILSFRPVIWQYYLNAMPIKLLGNLQTINQKTYGVIGFGAFDGAYIQFLLLFGILGIGFLIFLIWLISFKKGLAESKKSFLVLLLPIIFSGFTETNGFLITYSPLFFLIGSILAEVAYDKKETLPELAE
ncbi:hypothetical protein [Pediococcus acidilactici]|uniref:hypothetical protein n=1 Tax=Pediococcus acidilactici TaxID=1254 RepID=UPI000E5D3703|nr:hypothetical protein [Pediococcus acidilactici]RJF47243.1 hypothetical protein DSN65_07925 [Pediococcus acidilactici]